MRFSEFLRTTVLLSAAAATVLAVVGIAAAGARGDDLGLVVAAGWWIAAGAVGAWLGHREHASVSIASLLASARTQPTLPNLTPARTLLNRLWPLLLCTLGACAVALALPQVPIVGAGFAIIWAMGWRRQASAVTAIEERDGARFYVERTSPLRPMRLVRTPGFRSNLFELRSANGRAGVSPRV